MTGGNRGQREVSGQRFGFVRRSVTLEDVRGQVLSKDGFILTGHCGILPFQQLQGNSVHFHGPKVTFTLRFTRILQNLHKAVV